LQAKRIELLVRWVTKTGTPDGNGQFTVLLQGVKMHSSRRSQDANPPGVRGGAQGWRATKNATVNGGPDIAGVTGSTHMNHSNIEKTGTGINA
jgi:hypothetical protein